MNTMGHDIFAFRTKNVTVKPNQRSHHISHLRTRSGDPDSKIIYEVLQATEEWKVDSGSGTVKKVSHEEIMSALENLAKLELENKTEYLSEFRFLLDCLYFMVKEDRKQVFIQFT